MAYLAGGGVRHPHRRAGGRRRPDLFPRRRRGPAPDDRRREPNRPAPARRDAGISARGHREAGARLLAAGRVGGAATRGSRVGIRVAIRGDLVGDRERLDDRGRPRGARPARPRPQARPAAGWPPCWTGWTGPVPTRISRPSARRWGSRARSRAVPTSCLLHQHSEAEAAARVAVLERVILGFHLFFAAQGVELQVPRAGWSRRGSATGRITWRSCTAREPTLSRRPAAISTRRGTRSSPSMRGAARMQRAARAALARRRDELRRIGGLLDQMPARGDCR